MMVSSVSADSRSACEVFALLVGQRGFERQLDHADDAVHRRADFMAHVGQEFALGAAGGFGPRLGQRELLVDAAQLLPRALRSAIAHLDLVEHVVEAVDEHADLVEAVAWRADRIVLLARHAPRRVGEPQDGIRDHALEARREDEHDADGADEHDGGDTHVALHARVDLPEIRLDDQHAKPLAFEPHGLLHSRGRRAKDDAVGVDGSGASGAVSRASVGLQRAPGARIGVTVFGRTAGWTRRTAPPSAHAERRAAR